MTETQKKPKGQLSRDELEALGQLKSRESLKKIKAGGQNYMVPPIPPANAVPEEIADTTLTLPQPTAAMFRGLVGEVARAASARTEVNPVAAAMNFLSFLGAMCGRDVFFAVGDTFHHPRLFTLHVGRSSEAGKGDALVLVGRIRDAMAQQDPALPGRVHSGGLSSREGLASAVHDGYTVGKDKFEAIDDKRLWVVESEFANVLHQVKRDGNTLSSAIRDLWDGKSLQPLTKNSRVWATRPHVGIAAGISPGELHSVINARELSNGFANRFLMFWAERTGDVAKPVPTPWPTVEALAGQTAEVVRFALGGYPETLDSREMHRSAEADELYTQVYPWLKRCPGAELISVLLARRPPYVMRLAMLFALCEQTLTIERKHLESALAWVDYCSDSVRYLFASQAREILTHHREEMAAKIMEYLSTHPTGATLTELVEVCFQKHTPPLPICEVLTWMLVDYRYQELEMRERPRSDGKPGRAGKFYRLNRHPKPGT